MGCIVMHFSWSGGCGSYRNTGNRAWISPVLISGRQSRWDSRGYSRYVRARYQAYDTALARMLTEATALGADGVVGVDLRWADVDSGARELVALGTAVRHQRRQQAEPGGSQPPGTVPFYTELSASDVAAASFSGWRPLGITIGLSVAVKHEDATLRWQMSRVRGAGNVEVAGLTKLRQAARADARQKLAERAERFRAGAGQAGAGPAGAIQVVVSRSDLRASTSTCTQGTDHVAEATFVGTALTFDPLLVQQQRTGTALSILPLGPAVGSRRRGPDGPPTE
jgi:uncharacterized protein YbjQ (UPF0145 family)